MSPTALVVSQRVPTHDRDRGSVRVLQMIEFLQEEGWDVTFTAAHDDAPQRYTRILQQRGVATFHGFEHRFEALVEAQRFDLALLSYWHAAEQCLPILRAVSPQTRVIVDTQDLHFLRDARRRAGLHRGTGQAPFDGVYGAQIARELNVYAAADAVLAVSAKEAGLVDDLLLADGLARVVALCEDGLGAPAVGPRRGMLFVGNFRHLPNGEAVEFLCQDVLPRLDPHSLAAHPLRIVGAGASDTLQHAARGLPGVRFVGWVPRIEPYIASSRLSVVPLLHGAGVKGKLLTSLFHGTPAVATPIGVEGTDLIDGTHVLVASDGPQFAGCIQRLLDDDDCWRQLSVQGRRRVAQQHGRSVVKQQFLDALAVAAAVRPRGGSDPFRHGRSRQRDYSELQGRIRDRVADVLPVGCAIAVVSRGDDDLLALGDRRGWHFPQRDDGVYAGFHPADSTDAIALLHAIRDRGADYLLLPSTAFWWLHYYADFREHLLSRYVKAHEDADCTIFDLRGIADAEGRREVPAGRDLAGIAGGARSAVLALGVYRDEDAVAARRMADEVASASSVDVVQHWVCLTSHGVAPTTGPPAAMVIGRDQSPAKALNEVFQQTEPPLWDYVVLLDGTVELPHGFIDEFLRIQEQLGFAIAQPALPVTAVGDFLPPLLQQPGIVARDTAFVPCLPVGVIARSAVTTVFPLDDGHGQVWSGPLRWAAQMAARGLAMGIIDQLVVTPIASMAPAIGGSAVEVSDPTDRAAYARACTIRDVAVDAACPTRTGVGTMVTQPRISVVVATYQRPDLLKDCVASLGAQNLEPGAWEIVVVDDGSGDATPQVCEHLAETLPLRYLRIQHAGRSAAKNIGILAATGKIVCLFDDDDRADTQMLAAHLRTHEAHPEPGVTALGYTDWDPDLAVTPLMYYITDVGRHMFSYADLTHGEVLDFRYFWEGRLSCKRSLLVEHGLHDPRLHYSIDIDLGYRLARHGLKVVFDRQAISYMHRAVTYADFVARAAAKGVAQHGLATLHADPTMRAYARVDGAQHRWAQAAPRLAADEVRIAALEAQLPQFIDRIAVDGDPAMSELFALYGRGIEAHNARGLVQASEAPATPAPATPAPATPAPAVTASTTAGEDGVEVSVVIPIWNVRPELAEMTTRNIARILQLATTALEIVVVDNGSPCPGSYDADVLRRFPQNRGIAPAWNEGARLASGRVLVFANSDVEVRQGWDRALALAASDGRRIAFPYTDHADGAGYRRPDTAGAAGWCFALTRERYAEVGRFDERFVPAFWEDTDYWHRAWLLGIDLTPVPGARVWHARRTTARHHPDMDALHHANRARFASKHGLPLTAAPPFYGREIRDYVSNADPAGPGLTSPAMAVAR